MKPNKISKTEALAFLLWTVAVALIAATVAVQAQPPSPIKYRIEVRDKAPSAKECRELLKKYLKGI